MKFSLLINTKMPTLVDIFIFISREILMLSYLGRKNLQLSVIKDISAGQISCSAELSMRKVLLPRDRDLNCRTRENNSVLGNELPLQTI